MKKYYEMMYKAFDGKFFRWKKKDVAFTELGYSNSFCGDKYLVEGKEFRFMLVGRATNGWDVEVPLGNVLEFASEMENRIKTLGFGWVNEDGDELWTKNGTNPDERYWLSRSAFWRTARGIWKQLSGLEESRWIENIVWSNLYKVAPKKTGNPTTKMCRVQQKICKELLKAEIKFYKPTHILLVTGWNWLSWCNDDSFLSILNDAKQTGERYVVGAAFFEIDKDNKIPVVITNRPEYLKNDKYVEEVVKWFNKLTVGVGS